MPPKQHSKMVIDSISLGLTVLELCIKYAALGPLIFELFDLTLSCNRSGKFLYERCKNYKRADAEMSKAIIYIEGCWAKIEDQVNTLRDIWVELGEPLRLHHLKVVQQLHEIIESALRSLDGVLSDTSSTPKGEDGVVKQGQINRLKYAIHGKKTLDRTTEELDRWSRLFDPSWMLISRLFVPIMQKHLAEKQSNGKAIDPIPKLQEAREKRKVPANDCATREVFLDENYYTEETESIPFSTASAGLLAPGGKMVIIDKHTIRQDIDFEHSKENVQDLAIILLNASPTTSALLPCRGVMLAKDQGCFNIIFSIPTELAVSQPQSLRSLLLAKSEPYPLDERVKFSVLLARAVVSLHASWIVHKNIAPENIVMLHSNSPSGDLGTPILTGFEYFRFDEQESTKTGDGLWEKNLYRHPQRYGCHHEQVYNMRHDIYSVGVCLLEIGLWTSFIKYLEHERVPGPELHIRHLLNDNNKSRSASQIKEALVNLARSHLPQRMGRIYTNVVVTCLTCLDFNSTLSIDINELEPNEKGIIVGVRYIEKVSLSLQWNRVGSLMNSADIVRT